MRTLVISDLHLGSTTDVDVLRRPEAIEPLLVEAGRADRLVLLGDVIELRHGHAAEALDRALPALRRLGAAVPASAEIVVTAGNHDYAMIAPQLDYATAPLGLETTIAPQLAAPVARGIVTALGAARTRLAYPGVRIRDDVYAMHGHYSDVHTTLPLLERIAAGAMARLGARVPEHGASAEDYERALAPIYAWLNSVSQRTPPGSSAVTSGIAARIYATLAGSGHRTLSHRAVAVGFPLAVRALVPVVGPLSADLSVAAVRRGGLRAMGEVARRLGIDGGHLIFGHTHRAGPLPEDALSEWRTPTGVRLHNCGNWVLERHFTPSSSTSPYRPGTAIVVDGDDDPRLVRLLDADPWARSGAGGRPPARTAATGGVG